MRILGNMWNHMRDFGQSGGEFSQFLHLVQILKLWIPTPYVDTAKLQIFCNTVECHMYMYVEYFDQRHKLLLKRNLHHALMHARGKKNNNRQRRFSEN